MEHQKLWIRWRRISELDGGSLFLDGGGKDSSPICSVLQFGSWNAFFSTAGDGRPTSKAILRPYQKLVKGSGSCLTSQVRPLLRSATGLIVFSAVSGFFPASVLDGGSSDRRLDGGEREGPDCICSSRRRVKFPCQMHRQTFICGVVNVPTNFNFVVLFYALMNFASCEMHFAGRFYD
jgi:hypothetical protein